MQVIVLDQRATHPAKHQPSRIDKACLDWGQAMASFMIKHRMHRIKDLGVVHK
jgi:hypothetical protein